MNQNVEEDNVWTLCLTAPGRPRQLLQSIPSSWSLRQLYDAAETALEAATGTNTVESLKYGYPPKALDRNDKITTLREAGIRNQERIVMDISSTESASAVEKISAAESHSASPSKSLKRPKRAAAAAATASFAETIRAQDEALYHGTKQHNAKPVATTRKALVSKKTRFSAADTTGRRLQDGATVAAKKPSSQSRLSRQSRLHAGVVPSDPALALLGAVSSNTSSARLLRQGWRNAVQDAEEQSRAMSRLAAVTADQVHFTTSMSSLNTCIEKESDPDVHLSQLLVTYSKGIQGRGSFTDQVELISFAVLQSVILGIYPENPEALRPVNLALLSPRVFWSLLYHAKADNSDQLSSSSPERVSITSALQACAPKLDWSFLRRRKQQLSAKALENLRQQQLQDDNNNDAKQDWEAAARAIESVENAMDSLKSLNKNQQQARTAHAALQRQARQQNKFKWTLVTPNELDEDELRACILRHHDNEHDDVTVDEDDTIRKNANEEFVSFVGNDEAYPINVSIEKVIQWLIHDRHIHNWRELANITNAEQLAAELMQSFVTAPQTNKIVEDNWIGLVEAWIDFAQTESLSEIMFEICEGNLDAIDLLTEAAHSGTPKDLAAWRLIVQTLLQILTDFISSNIHTSANLSKKVVPSALELQTWCDRAQQAIDQLEWLHWYATPIKDMTSS